MIEASLLLAQARAGADPMGLWDVLRHDGIPVAAAYLVFVGMLVAYRRGSARGRRSEMEGTWPDLLRYVAVTVAGGYAVFLVIVTLFYLVLGGESPEFLRQALVEGSILTFGIVAPAFLGMTWLREARARRARRDTGGPTG